MAAIKRALGLTRSSPGTHRYQVPALAFLPHRFIGSTVVALAIRMPGELIKFAVSFLSRQPYAASSWLCVPERVPGHRLMATPLGHGIAVHGPRAPAYEVYELFECRPEGRAAIPRLYGTLHASLNAPIKCCRSRPPRFLRRYVAETSCRSG